MTKRKKMVISGYTFEELVCRYIKNEVWNSSIKSNYKFFCPRIHKGTEVDIIFITTKKVYAIECKNFNGYIAGKELEPLWRFASSGKRSTVANPVLANRKHVRTIRGIMYANGGNVIDIENIVCVRDSCKIHTECKEVMTLSRFLYKLSIDAYLPDKYNIEEVSKLIDSIRHID